MTPIAIAVLSLSMSTDAFAAAVGRGASHRPTLSGALKAGLVFGVIEAITPLIGWALGMANIAAGSTIMSNTKINRSSDDRGVHFDRDNRRMDDRNLSSGSPPELCTQSDNSRLGGG